MRDYRVLTARGPFSLQDELRLLTEHHISLIVAKNSGGEATYAKIEAARRTGLPVIMIERPADRARSALAGGRRRGRCRRLDHAAGSLTSTRGSVRIREHSSTGSDSA